MSREVRDWLESIKLGEYWPQFQQLNYTTLVRCRKIDDNFLDRCCIEKVGHRKRLLRAAADLGIFDSSSPAMRNNAEDVPVAPPRKKGSIKSPVSLNPVPSPRPIMNSPQSIIAEESEEGTPPPLPPKQASAPRRPPPPTADAYQQRRVTAATSTPPVIHGPRTQMRSASVIPKKSERTSVHTSTRTPQGNRGPKIFSTGEHKESSWDPTNATLGGTTPRLSLATGKQPARPPRPIAHGGYSESQKKRKPGSVVPGGGAGTGAPTPTMVVHDDDDDGSYVTMAGPRNSLSPDQFAELAGKGAAGPPLPRRHPGPTSSAAGSGGDGETKNLEVIQLKSKTVSERTKEGYLNKKGGKNGTKGWDKRWFELSGGVLKYYKDREKKPTGMIRVDCMLDVRPIIGGGGTGGRHAHRFELDTPDRTFYFSADTVAEMTEWMMLLGAMIQDSKGKADDSANATGGSMASADKVGWVQIRGKDFRQTWHRHYLAIKDGTMCFYSTYDDFARDEPLHRLELMFVSLKLAVGGKKERNHQFQVVTRANTFECRAESQGEMKSIADAINTGILWSLNQLESDKNTDVNKIKPEKVLEMLRTNRSNYTCADCSAGNPDWASINLGCMFCVNCAGIHRSLGVHVSKVRSTTLDDWNETLIALVVGIGNARSNAFWEGALDSAGGQKTIPTATKEERLAYITKKYVDRAYLKFQHPPTSYTLDALRTVVMTDDLMATVEHVQAGVVGTDTAGAARVLCEAAHNAGQDAQVELLVHNGLEWAELDRGGKSGTAGGTKPNGDAAVAPPPADVPVRFRLLSKAMTWETRWLAHYGLGMVRIFHSDAPDAEALASIPFEHLASVSAGTALEVDDDGGNIDGNSMFEFKLAGDRVALGRNTLTWQADCAATQKAWVQLLQASIASVHAVSPMAVALDVSDFTHHGMLARVGADGPQKQRLYAVRGRQLRYFTSLDDPTELGCIELFTVRSVMPGAITGTVGASTSPGLFSLVSVDAIVVLDAGTAADMHKWVDTLRNSLVFGAAIESFEILVPFVVEECCNFIEASAQNFDEVYTVGGNHDSIDELKEVFNRDGGTTNVLVGAAAQKYSVHDVAALLQLFFMELPEPLLPPTLHAVLLQADGIWESDCQDAKRRMGTVIDTLPGPNHDTLMRMYCVFNGKCNRCGAGCNSVCSYNHCTFLLEQTAAQPGASTSMASLACVFGPLFFGADVSDGDEDSVLNPESRCLEHMFAVVQETELASTGAPVPLSDGGLKYF